MASFPVGVRLSWDALEVGIALPTKPSGEGEPWAELQGGTLQALRGRGGGRDSMLRGPDDSGLGWGPDRHIFRRKVTLRPSLRDIPPSNLLPRGPGNQALGRGVVCMCVCANLVTRCPRPPPCPPTSTHTTWVHSF